MPVDVYSDEVFLEHQEHGHPERPERIAAIGERLKTVGQVGVSWRGAASAVADDALEAVHPREYWQTVQRMADDGGGWFDPDTYCGARSYHVARIAAGTAVAATRRAIDERRHAFALLRPPGHHASADRAMGFCLFNNVAIAARAAQQQDGIERVAILDIDVHHGNGTQDIFYDDPTVLYCSLHQWPFYPGTGSADETGAGAGAGTTVNVPLPAGTIGAAWLGAFDSIVAPAVTAFRPDLVLVSAGLDAHRDDPLGQLSLSTQTYGAVAARIIALAKGTTGAVSGWFLEGGYDLAAISDSAAAIVSALAAG